MSTLAASASLWFECGRLINGFLNIFAYIVCHGFPRSLLYRVPSMPYAISAYLQPVSQRVVPRAAGGRTRTGMEAVLFLRQPSHLQPMELDRVEAVRDSDPGV